MSEQDDDANFDLDDGVDNSGSSGYVIKTRRMKIREEARQANKSAFQGLLEGLGLSNNPLRIVFIVAVLVLIFVFGNANR